MLRTTLALTTALIGSQALADAHSAFGLTSTAHAPPS